MRIHTAEGGGKRQKKIFGVSDLPTREQLILAKAFLVLVKLPVAEFVGARGVFESSSLCDILRT